MIVVGGHWRVAAEIVTLTRGEARILFNPEQFFPVFLPQGGDELASILGQFRGEVRTAPPDPDLCPPDLFQFLLEHAIFLPMEQEAPSLPLQVGCLTEQRCAATPGDENRPARLQVFLLLSHLCNLSCLYCLNGRETYRAIPHRIMTLATARMAVETLLSRLANHGVLEVVFFGGEPLLNWSPARELMRLCREEIMPRHPNQKIRFSLTTNLYQIPDDLSADARKFGVAVLVNVDGPAELHDITRPAHGGAPSFTRVRENIKRLVGEGVTVDLRATITTVNVAHMVEVVALHRELGGSSSALLPMNPIDSDGTLLPSSLLPDPAAFAAGLTAVYAARLWPVENLHPFSEYNRRLRPGYRMGLACDAALGRHPVVTADGEIFSCPYLVNQGRFAMGDLATGDFPKPEAVKVMTDLILAWEQRQNCRSCGYRYLCGGGCSLGAFAATGKKLPPRKVLDDMDAINCATTRSCVEALLWDRGDSL
ncbi:MAG: radical SAM protein [Magnetococcales bacterium]|nr:radical SAM protein [Magnetococcales bacterium]